MAARQAAMSSGNSSPTNCCRLVDLTKLVELAFGLSRSEVADIRVSRIGLEPP
jgi:hypothetical protein